MLFIPDIHITRKHSDAIIAEITRFVDTYPDETIIFAGDMVYHFQPDRAALLQLFDLFVRLYKQGRTVYVLAGNHDYIGETYVYEEAKRAFEILGNITFLTTPHSCIIEGINCLLLPYMINTVNCESEHELVRELCESKNKQRIASASASNEVINWYVNTPGEKMLIHHYYMAGNYEGLKFSYDDVALFSEFFEYEMTMVSGHIHKPFHYKNWTCIGSIRATSRNESNQWKGLFRYHEGKWTAHQTAINAYVQLPVPEKGKISSPDILRELERAKSTVSRVSVTPAPIPEDKISLTLVSDKVFEITDVVEGLDKIENIKSKIVASTDDMFEWNEMTPATLTQWKDILKEYVQKKYGSTHVQKLYDRGIL